MPQPAPDPASDAAGPRPIDDLDEVRLLLPLPRDLPNPPASAAAPLHAGETFTSVHHARRFVATLDASLFDPIVCAGAATVSMAQLEPARFDPCDGRARHIVDG